MLKNHQTASAELIRRLNEATLHEEQALPVYTEHIKSAFDWLDLSDEAKQQLQDGLQILAEESRGHITLLAKIKKLVSE